MAALLISDSKILTCFSPLGAMRPDAFPARTKLGQQMRQFMQEGALDFFGAVMM